MIVDLCKERRTTLSVSLLLTISLIFVFIWSLIPYAYTVDPKAQPFQEPYSSKAEEIVFGAWVPARLQLENLHGDKLINAIHTLLSQGYDEYYSVMRDFTNSTEREKIEAMLNSTDTTDLKIIIILLPPGEGGSHANYDWKGWMLYFNSLKEKHPSFLGFAVDDFNAIVDIRRIYIMNNMDLMGLSNFSSALSYKRDDVQFYPVMYVETGEFETLKKVYNKFADGLILVSTLYHNISYLENYFANLSKTFYNNSKSIKFIVYPIKSGFDAPSDRLIMATLSISSRWVDGIIIYVNTDDPTVLDFLHNHENPIYMSAIGEMERLQAKDEIIKSRRDIPMCTFCLYEGS